MVLLLLLAQEAAAASHPQVGMVPLNFPVHLQDLDLATMTVTMPSRGTPPRPGRAQVITRVPGWVALDPVTLSQQLPVQKQGGVWSG